MHPIFMHHQTDLVDFDEVHLFMFTQDNLYQNFVPDRRKRRSLDSFYQNRESGKLPELDWAFFRPGQKELAKHAVLILLEEYLLAGRPFTLLDIGSFVGDFAIRVAEIARRSGAWFQAVCFDPTFAGALIPHNIALNRLESLVTFENLAIAKHDGPQMISQSAANADSGEISDLAGAEYRYVVPGEKISTYIRRKQLGPDLVVKIDVEGLDCAITVDLLQSFGAVHSLILELSPNSWLKLGYNPVALLAELSKHYHLFDLHYLPCPTRARRVDENALTDFVVEVASRIYHYTDVMAVPKAFGFADRLIARLSALEEQPSIYTMID